MSDDEFWALRPIEFEALLDRWLEQEKRQDLRVAVIISSVANLFRGKGKKALKPEDVMKKDKPLKQTWQSQLKKVEMLNAAFRGKDLRSKKDG